MINNTQTVRKGAYLIFLLSASFYLYEFILQVAPSVMADSMMNTFKINAAGFGIVSAFYFYAYAPMQLPAGLLFDRYGPRKLMTFALLLCAMGSFFFASTNCLWTAALGRFLIGIGSAFSFIGVLVLISRWFLPYQFAFLAGIAQSMSSVGAMFGEMPLAALVGEVGWRTASFILAFLGVALALLIWTIIRDYPENSTVNPEAKLPKGRLRDEWRRLQLVCKHKYTWTTGLYACTSWTPIAVFAALWGVPYLQQKYQISVLSASGLCSMIWFGIGVGSPLLGLLSDKFYNRRIALAISGICGFIACVFILYLKVPMQWMYLCLFMLGFGAGGQTLSFAVVKDNNSDELVGTASGFNNLSVLIGGAIFQPLVGIFLSRLQAGNPLESFHIYTIDNFNTALAVMPICYLINIFLALFIMPESHPNHSKLYKPSHLMN